MAAADTYTAPADWAANEKPVASAKLNQQVRDNTHVLQLGLNGDGSSQAEGIHQHLSNTYANIPAAGNVGRRFYATDLCCEFLDDGTSWLILPPPLEKCEYFFDDFLHDNTGLRWVQLEGGTGTVEGADDDDSRIALSTGGNAGSRAAIMLRLANVGHYGIGVNRVPAILEFKVRQNQAGGLKYFGLTNTASFAASAEPTDAIMFRHLDGAVNWFGVCRAGGVETTRDTGSNDNLDHIFRIVIESTTNISFWFDGSQVGADVTTNLSADNLILFFHINNGGAAQDRAMRAEYVQMVAARA